MRKFAFAAVVAFAPTAAFAFAPVPDFGQHARVSLPVVEVGCKWEKNCGAKNRVGIDQRNKANVHIRSDWASQNNLYIDQRNRADVDLYSGQNSQNDVYINQQNKANVHIR